MVGRSFTREPVAVAVEVMRILADHADRQRDAKSR